MPSNPNFAIYGANGYTGELIAELAVQKGLCPLLAGRNEEALKPIAKRLNLNYEVVDLNHKDQVNDLVLSVDAVLHCAGPFVHTVKPMVNACMKNGTHYLDITGEIEVFEQLASMDEEIKEAGIMVLPGIGFDVVPTDCMAAYLKKSLPTATHLTLGFLGLGGISHGTATTMLENLGEPSLIRKKGEIIEIPSGSKTRMIPFNKKPRLSVAIPWGDVSTAYHSTGIPNIEVYMGASKNVVNFLQFSENFKWLVTTSMIKNLIQSGIDSTIKGPDAKKRRTGKSYIYGEVQDANGSVVSARMITPEGYTLTSQTAVTAIEKVLKGTAPIGFQTPSTAFGHNFILEMPNVTREDLNRKRNIDIL